ncbi:hypothetical protein [Burkholderia pseudomallei]|uniref:hypothetical protein n=1 Tax=Burkholderia pseudomallei TaxID=28450 RepID=UPI0012AEC3FE|nr:hypothetical protein [Burkholderia pseudomallei]MBF3383894.1 hypothetical protein [Burkholderia pseudomallei]MBF3408044.1 hypothetical protein [Burkholderia pseudomallei]
MTNDDGRRAATGEKPRPDGDGKPDGERKTAGGNRWLVGGCPYVFRQALSAALGW